MEMLGQSTHLPRAWPTLSRSGAGFLSSGTPRRWTKTSNTAAITDKEWSEFGEAEATVLHNLTQEEQQRIAAMASEIQAILTAAKERDQEKLRKAY